MPSSTTDSIYTRSNYSPDRSSRPTSISTAATSRSATPQASLNAVNNKKSVKIKPRKPRPKSQPGDWSQVLRLPSDPSIAPSRGSSLRATQSYTDLRTKVNRQNAVPPLPGAMGGNRTSLSMNGPLDAHRRMSSYDEQYRYKDNVYGSARERIHRESPVIAELRTNVIIKDEFTLVTDMSYHLAARYSRPDSSIMINVDHSSCLALAGTFEPCYILSISALPSQMQATTNKRNAALIQSFMADILSVPPERGVIKFIPVPEENFAYNGNTISGEIERLEQQHMGNSGAKRAIADVRKSMPAFSSKRSTSKIDADFAKKADKADGFDGHIEEMQNGIVPAPLKTQTQIPDVFDLVSRRDDEERPSTAHATSSNGTFAALNGLRLNGITKEDLEGPNSKTPNGRPKTFSGGPVWSSTEDFNLVPRRGSDEGAPAPTIKSEPKQQVKERKSPFPEFKDSSRSSTPVQKQTPRISSPIQTVKTAATITATEKTKPAYLENPPKSALAKNHARSKSKTQSPPEALPQDDSQAANTAKRRSTIQNDSRARKAPAPPPVPESKQAKVSKRKSFLAAFRR